MAQLRDLLITLCCSLLAWCFRPFRNPPPLPPNPDILLLKPCCLGDLLLATPAIAALRERFPHARIVLATSPWSRPAVDHNPHLTEILPWQGMGLGGLSRLGAAQSFLQELRRRGFHAAVVLDRSPLVTLLPWLAGIPFRAGLDSQGRGFSLTHPVKVTPHRHEAQLYLDAVAALGCQTQQPALQFFPTPQDRGWAEALLDPRATWIAVHPGGGINPTTALLAKRWPGERYAAIVARLLHQGFSVVLVGDAQDRALTQATAEKARQSFSAASAPRSSQGLAVSSSARLVDLSGETTFGQLGAVLQGCRLFVGNDTGPMHLAVAVGTPVVAIFGPSQPARYGPLSSQAEVVHHGEECRSCRFRGGLITRCVRAYACMAAATVEEVWAAVERRLASGAHPPAPPPAGSLQAPAPGASI